MTTLRAIRPEKESELREVEVAKMKVDPRYQRGATNQRRIDKIARAWDWDLCEPLVVSFRDGFYFVVVGQHRALAARQAEIKILPCLVLYDRTSHQEARIFDQTDAQTLRLTQSDHHKARVHEGIAEALEVDRIVRAYGHAGFSSKSSGSLRAVSAAYSLQRLGVLDHALEVINGAWRRDDDTWAPLANNGQVLRAIGEFLRRFPDVPINDVGKACSRHNPGELRIAGFGGQYAGLDGWRLVRDWYNRGRTVNRLGPDA